MKPSNSITKLYLPHEKIMVINESPQMIPIDIPLPDPPELQYIDGYGLHPSEQFYKRPTIPESLIRIQRESDSISQAWERLDMNRHQMKEEINWVRKMWYYRLNGYWFFNAGVPTHITPAHFLLLAFMRLNIGRPHYRDRGRKYHETCEWVKHYTYDFKDKIYDDKGIRQPNKRGDELVDLGERTLFGLANPKGRRLTATTDALSWVINSATLKIRTLHGIQSYDAKSSKEPYLELVKMFRTLPFWFLPEFNRDAETSLKLVKQGGNIFDDLGLQTIIEPAVTGHSGHFDGRELEDYILDEAGKKVNEKLSLAWTTVKNTLAWSDDKIIRGFAILPSNAGEFRRGGGREYLQFIKDSNYYERTDEGRTQTGCITLFLSSDEGAQGYIDKHGNSLKEKAKLHFLSNRKHLLDEDTPESLEKYNKHLREHPLELMECFMTESGMLGFDMMILNKRISEIQFGKKEVVVGDFVWTAGFGSHVEFKENPYGMCEVSELLPVEKTNLKYSRNGTWYPKYPASYMHTSDPFNYAETEGRKQSKGSITGIKRRGYAEDNEKDISKWTTPDVSYQFLSRPKTIDEFADYCLRITLYYGGLHSPESNNERVRQLFTQWGYSGFLYFFRDDDGTYRKTAGYIKTGGTGDKLITHGTRYVLLHGHRIKHLQLLLQAKEFRGVEDITRLDAIASFCGACMSIDNDYRSDEYRPKSSGIGVTDLFLHH